MTLCIVQVVQSAKIYLRFHSLYPPRPPAERGYLGFLEVGDKGGGLRIFRIQGGFRFCGHRNFPGGVGFWEKNSPAAGIQESGFSKISPAAG